MKRYLETFFRAKYLYVAVLVLMVAGAAVGTYYLSRSQFESSAQIWIDSPVLNNVVERQVVNYGVVKTPAQEQADKLYQLLQTDSFIVTLLQGTSLAGQLDGVREHDERVIENVRLRLVVGVLGANTLKIVYSGPDPVLCQQIIEAAITQFRNWSLQAQVEQTAVELQFYQQLLKIYDEQVNDLVRRIGTLQQEHPSITSPGASSPQALEFRRLERELDSARDLQSTTKLKIDQTGLVNSQSPSSKLGQFHVLDKPGVPSRPVFKLTKLVAYFGAGVAAGVILVLGIVIVATWQDATVRSTDDIRRLSNIPVLVVIPRLPTGAARRRRREPRRTFLLTRPQQGTGD